jgi:hypothetical protein
MDTSPDPEQVDLLEQHVKAHGLPFQRISAVAGTGLDELQESMWKYLSDARPNPDLAPLQEVEHDS